MKPVPTHYHLEIYESSFVNDPVLSVESTTPFMAISKGDRFNYRSLADLAWYHPPAAGQALRVKDVEHIFWVIEDSHIGHKLMVCLDSFPVETPEQ